DLIGHTDDVVTARERARAQFTEDLLAAARVRLATDGAAGLSLRAVARDLGVASSAVYRYVPSRDALLTLLILEAYDAVGAGSERAGSHTRRDPARRGACVPPMGPGPPELVRARVRHPRAGVRRAPGHRAARPPDLVRADRGGA